MNNSIPPLPKLIWYPNQCKFISCWHFRHSANQLSLGTCHIPHPRPLFTRKVNKTFFHHKLWKSPLPAHPCHPSSSHTRTWSITLKFYPKIRRRARLYPSMMSLQHFSGSCDWPYTHWTTQNFQKMMCVQQWMLHTMNVVEGFLIHKSVLWSSGRASRRSTCWWVGLHFWDFPEHLPHQTYGNSTSCKEEYGDGGQLFRSIAVAPFSRHIWSVIFGSSPSSSYKLSVVITPRHLAFIPFVPAFPYSTWLRGWFILSHT